MHISALRLLAGGCAALILTACPGDDASSADESSSSGGTENPTADSTLESTIDPETTVTPTTDGTTTVDPTTGESTAADTTAADTTAADTTAADTTAADTTGTSESSSSDSSSDGTSTTGETLCADQDLGGAVPVVVMIDTTDEGDDFYGSCAGDINAPDVTFSFTAEVAGDYLFTTSRDATDIDTVLYLLDATCDGDELACNDDFDPDAGVYTSLVVAPLAAGQTVIVVVDGYSSIHIGQVELSIDLVPAPGDGGSCCEAFGGDGGCDVETVEACVCGFDEFCCDTEWDASCVAAGTDLCQMTCENGGGTCEAVTYDDATLDDADPTVHRVLADAEGGACSLGGADAVFYDVYEYTLVGPGPHQLVADMCGTADFDSVVDVYQSAGGEADPFDPDAPCVNLVGHSDDAFGCGSTSIAEVTGLDEGLVQVVVHAYDNDETGTYSLTISSDSCE